MPSVLVVGAGMYTCGRATSGYGTILPTLLQARREGAVGDVWVAATSPKSARLARLRCGVMQRRLGVRAPVKFFPEGSRKDPLCYRRALARMRRPARAIVSVPDHLHASIAADIIQAGVHCLVVKPLTPTLREARRLIRLQKEHGVYAAVEFHKRFDETNLVLRQYIDDGKLGDLRYVLVEFSQRRGIRDIFGAWESQTNIFQYLGVHYVDLIYFLTGAKPLRVLACGQPRRPPWDAIETVVDWELLGGKQFTSIIVVNWIDPNKTSAMSDQKILVVGTKGRYQADQKHRGVEWVSDDGVEHVNPYFNQTYRSNEGTMEVHGYGPKSIRQFLADADAIDAGAVKLEDLEASRPTLRQGLLSTAVIEAAKKSLRKNSSWITLKQI